VSSWEAEREALLARLLERAIERTGELAARLRVLLGAELGLPGSDTDNDVAGLGRLQDEVSDLGWALGRLGAELGADAMGPRHHRYGLAVLVTLADQELTVAGALPPAGPGGHELTLLLALLRCGGGAWDVQGEAGFWRFKAVGEGPDGEVRSWLEDLGLGGHSSDEAWTLDVPETWLQDGPPPT